MADEALGPFFGMAAFCEYVLDEKDNVLSAIRIIDRVTLVLEEEMQEGAATTPYFVSCMIRFGSFRLSTEHTLTVKLKNPAGEEKSLTETPLIFQAERTGVNFVIKMGLGFKWEGIYWLMVYLDNAFVTQVPLRVEFRVEANGSSDSQTTEQPEP